MRGAATETRRMVRADMHVHTRASSGPVIAALGYLGCPESYSEPEAVYDQARARGMDLVAITDHDTIDGGLELLERGFQDVILGEEVTVYFPEDRCKLHVLVWGLTSAEHEEIGTQRLRDDVYLFAAWLRQRNLPHALAHPLYAQSCPLTRRHIDRCALLFKGFETLNGAHSGTHRSALDRYLARLTPAVVHRMIDDQSLQPLWPRVWEKVRTGGSDDHALLNVGRTWTAVPLDFEERAYETGEFLRRVMIGRAEPAGQSGHSSLLAHQVAAVTSHFLGRTRAPKLSPVPRAAAGKMLRFAGVATEPPSTPALAADAVLRKLRGKRSMPLLDVLQEAVGPLLEKYPEIRTKLDPALWTDGSALSDHDRMAEFADDLYAAAHRLLAGPAVEALRRKDRAGIVNHLLSYAVLELAQLPYYISLFHQNKDRPFVESLEHHCGGPGAGPLERPMRVSLFTDTLGDINGVCRFIQNVADCANRTGRDLQVITSTRLSTPKWANIHNFEPIFATGMPKYDNLEVCLPPLLRILRHVDRHQPDVIHISTPGPVGLAGLLAGRMLKVPILGVYHTDFPAYVDRLLDDQAFTWICRLYMKWFYTPFRAIFTRSVDYVESLTELGMKREAVVPLLPGVDVDVFHPRYRDVTVWRQFAGVQPDSVKVLYVGRVSVEKNMPLLKTVWKRVASRLAAVGAKAELIVVGDGPYRRVMEEELAGDGVHYLGFRHGEELSRIYASSDVFLFPSTTDTLGQVVMESQACGIPAIVTDKGGPKEVVREGVSGHVLASEDPERWVELLVSLCRDRQKLPKMGRAARELMETMSIARSFEAFWENHERVWKASLADRGIEAAPNAAVGAGMQAAPALRPEAAATV